MLDLANLTAGANGKPVLIDWFCGAGGATAGFQRAGFYVIGVDNVPQPNYCGDAFVLGDAIALMRATTSLPGVAAQHASPPCPHYSVLHHRWGNKDEHPDWIALVRGELSRMGLPFSIENVMGARSVMNDDAVKLCGSMFDLAVERHRLFECHGFTMWQPKCAHQRQRELWPDGFPALRSGRAAEGKRARVVGVFGHGGGETKDLATWKWAMDVPWMKNKREVSNSIPPAYTEHVGVSMLSAIEHPV